MATPVSPPETVSTPSGRTCQREIGATGRPGGRQATQAKRGRPQELNHARSRLASQVCLDLIWCSAQTSLQPRGLVQIRGVLNLVRSFGDRCMSLNDAVGTAFAHGIPARKNRRPKAFASRAWRSSSSHRYDTHQRPPSSLPLPHSRTRKDCAIRRTT